MKLLIKQRIFSWTDSYDIYDENGKVNPDKVEAITFDPFNNTYVQLGKTVGNAFSDGKKLND